MTISITTVIAYAVFVIFVFRRWRGYTRLSHVPGPRFAGWTRLPMVLDNISGRCHEILYDYSLKYGPLVRLGPNHLITSDYDVYQRMYAPNSAYRRAPWYGVFRFKPRSDNLFSTVDEIRHTDIRRKMAAGYAGREVPGMEAVMDVHVRNWVDLIGKYVGKTKGMDIGRQCQYFTLDVISDLAFNQSFNDIPSDKDNFQYVKTTEEAISVMTLLTLFPSVHRWIEQSRLMDLMAPKAKDRTGLGPIVGIAQLKVGERFGEDGKLTKDENDMLGSFLRHGLSREDAESETVMQIMAGSDTSATVMRVVFLHVLSSPRIFNKLRMEIDDGIKSGMISKPIKDDEGRKLPYLQGCIKEAFRLWPVVVGISLKQVPPEGDNICGYEIPGGTFIGHNAWAFGRDDNIYGPDFEVYRPERWVEATGKQLELMERNKELAFGYGRFKCLGQPVAYMELNKVFVEILRKFDLEVMDPSKPWDSRSHGIFLQKNFNVKVSLRG